MRKEKTFKRIIPNFRKLSKYKALMKMKTKFVSEELITVLDFV